MDNSDMYDVIKTIISVLSPFIGAACGVYLVPFIEQRKTEQLTSELILNFREELKDLEIQASEAAKLLYASHVDLQRYNNGKIDRVMFYGLTRIDVYFIDEVIKKAFSKLTFDERKAIKALIFMIKKFNDLNQSIANQISNLSRDLNFKQSLTYAANIYWICSKINSSSKFQYAIDHDNDVELKKALEALHIPSI